MEVSPGKLFGGLLAPVVRETCIAQAPLSQQHKVFFRINKSIDIFIQNTDVWLLITFLITVSSPKIWKIPMVVKTLRSVHRDDDKMAECFELAQRLSREGHMHQSILYH